MAITAIDRQAVKLQTSTEQLYQNTSRTCNCYAPPFCQLVERADDTIFQVDLTPLDGTDEIQDGTFNTACGGSVWTCGTGWTIGSGVASFAGGGGAGLLAQDFNTQDNTLYQVTYTIANLTGNLSSLSLGGTQISLINADGTFTKYVFTSGAATRFFTVSGANAESFDIDEVRIVKMSTVGIRIKDEDSNIIYEEDDGTSVTYSVDTAKAQIQIDWTTIVTDGCYNICLFDVASVNLISNGHFTVDGTDWTVTGLSKWTFPGGVASGDATPAASTLGDRQLTQTLAAAMQAGNIYELQFSVVNYLTGSVTPSTDDLTLTSRSANASYTESIDLTTEVNQTFIRFTLSDATGELDLDNVAIFLSPESQPDVLFSECFDLKDTHTCSVLFTATNDENAFGLDFTNFSFTQSFRHCVKDRKPSWRKPNRTLFVNSRKRYTLLRTDNLKINTLEFDEAPDFIHEFIAIMFDYDTTTIDGQEFVSDDEEYEPDWVKSSLLASSEMEVIKQDQNFQNNNC